MTTAAADTVDRCAWPGCRHGDDPLTAVMVSDDGGETFWCLCHLGDDCLPVLEAGPCRACNRCGQSTWEQTVSEPNVPLHEHCRRTWAMAQDARPALGAYARRSRG